MNHNLNEKYSNWKLKGNQVHHSPTPGFSQNPFPFHHQSLDSINTSSKISSFSEFLQWNPTGDYQMECPSFLTEPCIPSTSHHHHFEEPTLINKDISQEQVTEKKKQKKNVKEEKAEIFSTPIKKRKRRESDRDRENGKALTAFSKRKSSLLKKGFEISELTGAHVLILMVSPKGKVNSFSTSSLQPMIGSCQGRALLKTCLEPSLSSGDLQGKGKEKEKEKDYLDELFVYAPNAFPMADGECLLNPKKYIIDQFSLIDNDQDSKSSSSSSSLPSLSSSPSLSSLSSLSSSSSSSLLSSSRTFSSPFSSSSSLCYSDETHPFYQMESKFL